MEPIDLRSDTVTKPTEEMRSAMYRADVGDDGWLRADGKGEDPTVNELERLAAKTLGKEDALLVPSGTMGNLLALMTYCSRGDEVAVGQHAHIYRREKAGFTDGLLALRALEVPDPMGIPDLSALRTHLQSRRPRVFCMENTHNYAGGTVVGREAMLALADAAHSHGVQVHLDGARIFNASVALGADARSLVGAVDSVMFCLSKGLSAPVGSMLVGSTGFIQSARAHRKVIGGQLRQAGVFAAAGIVALNQMVTRLEEDHRKARQLAERLVRGGALPIDLATVQTNIVKINVSSTGLTAKSFQQEMRSRAVLVHVMSDYEIRLVTHKDVGLDRVLQAADLINLFASSPAANRS